MTCAEFEDLILDDVDGRIASGMAALLNDHLAGCEQCRGFLTAQRELDRALGDVRVPELPPRFAARVLKRSRAEACARGLGFVWDLAGVASVAVAAGVAAAYLFPHLIVGVGWVAAGVFSNGGVWLTLAEPPVPSS